MFICCCNNTNQERSWHSFTLFYFYTLISYRHSLNHTDSFYVSQQSQGRAADLEIVSDSYSSYTHL